MGSMAVAIVAVPLFLASDLDLGPARIGAVVFTLALAMTAAGPVAARVGRRHGSGVQLGRGVLILVVAAPVVTLAMVSSGLGVARWVIVSLVVLGLVAAVVAYARQRGWRVAPQATGHNAAPLGSLEGTLILNTSALTGFTIDAEARRVEINKQ